MKKKIKQKTTPRGDQLLLACSIAFNQIPNKKLTVRGFRETNKLSSEIGAYLRADCKTCQYHNVSFAEMVEKEFQYYPALAYNIEHDTDNDVWNLCVHSTSSSEICGSEEGPLEEFSYQNPREIIEDIQTFEKLHYPYYFEEM